MSVTIADIGAKAGDSIPTVLRVLNNRPEVTPGTRERVKQVIKESRCIASREANGLRKESDSIIDIPVAGLLIST
jgi:LacI family transcriptional regulator